jgi:FG-GAP repeat protein
MFPCSLPVVLSGCFSLLFAQGKPALAPPPGAEALGADFPAIVTAAPLDFGGFLSSTDEFGRAATELGDLDGDGVQDLAVGMPGAEFDRGVVAMFVGSSPDGRPRHYIGQGSGGFGGTLTAFGRFGTALASIDDLDGDGIRELAVGTSAFSLWILFLDADGQVREERQLTSPLERFGSALALLGDLDGDGLDELAVGVPGADVGGTNQGAVQILFLNVDGSLRGSLTIGESTGGFGGTLEIGDEFGSALACPGDLDGNGVRDLLVGTPLDDVNSSSDQGSVWVLFLQPGGAVVATASIVSPASGTPNSIDHFGWALAGLGDLDGNGTREIAVGAPRDDDGGNDRGAVWLFSLSAAGSVLSERKFSATSGGFVGPLVNFDTFGSALASLEDRNGDGQRDLFVGAPLGESGTCFDAGEAWFLFLAATGGYVGERRGGGDCAALPRGAHYGSAFADLGDMDGNGTRELAVGSAFENAGSGKTRLLSLANDGSIVSQREITGFAGTARFGSALANLGDLDGDGSIELAVGLPNVRTVFPASSGAAWILSLSENGDEVRRTNLTAPISPSSRFGKALAALADMDGNGVRDLAVGMPGVDQGGLNAGAVQILRLDTAGGIVGRMTIDGTDLPLLQAGDRFGSALASLGDLDGDGVDELAVGAQGFDSAFEDRGMVWVLFLRPDGSVRAHRRISTGLGGFTPILNTNDRFGQAVAGFPDLDGDGLGELLVGAPGDDGSGTNSGAVWALFLASDGSVKSARKLAPGLAFPDEVGEGSAFGAALGAMADLNGDGRPEFAVGATLEDRMRSDAGMAWVAMLGGSGHIDFQTEDDLVTPLVDGQALTTPPQFGRLFRLSASGANLGAAIFDSSPGGPNDPSQDLDLLVDKGHVLILQSSTSGTQSVPGIFDRPNDSSTGGTLRFEFLVPQRLLSLDLVDIDLDSARYAHVRLTDTSGRWREYTVPPGFTEDAAGEGPPGWRTLSLTTLAPQNGAFATATAGQLAGFDGEQVSLLEVQLDGSGAVDDLRFEADD